MLVKLREEGRVMFRLLKSLILVSLLGFLTIQVHALYARYTEQELVERSELIVAGSLIAQTTLRISPESNLLTVGVLNVDEVIKGDSTVTVALLTLHTEGQLIASDTIFHSVGQEGLWFLRQQPNSEGLYLADHPQRFEIMQDDATGRLAEVRSLVADLSN